MDTDAQKALADTEYDLNSLEARICNEFKIWTIHLTISRRKGPHKLPVQTSFKNDRAVLHELQMLTQQIAACNVRAAATRDRNIEFPDVTLGDLIAEEEIKPTSTELPRPLLRRIIITSRIRLHAFSLMLHDQETRMTAAYITLLKMARSISDSLEEGKADTLCDAWTLVRDTECMILALKATMAKVGMRMARQCVIPEFFWKVEGEGEGQGQGSEDEVNQQGDVSIRREEDEKMRDVHGDGDDGSVDADVDEESDVESEECESESNAEVGVALQTRITDYFVPVPKGS